MSETVPIDTSDRSYGATALSELRVLTVSVDLVCDAHEIDLGKRWWGELHTFIRSDSRVARALISWKIAKYHLPTPRMKIRATKKIFTDMCVHGRAKQSRIYVYIMP